jgi:hypothetical protein
MTFGGKTPEELETLLEDAILLQDAAAIAGLFEDGSVIVMGKAGPTTRGRDAIERSAARLWQRRPAYLADPRCVVRTGDLALVIGDEAINVARRNEDGAWRYAISVLTDGYEEER